MKRLFAMVLAPLGTVAFAALLVLERRRPLRRTTADANIRLARNIGMSAVTGVALQLLFLPVMTAVARIVEQRRIGLMQWLPLSRNARIILSIPLLDYTYYWWHRLLHQVPLLWRFHVVHHADLDMDVSTAIRFHFGEWILSTPYRALQTLLLGTPERGVAAFEISMVLSILFHHSNLRLPFGAERLLCRFMVTPRMHGIHHSVIERESASNFSTFAAIWDRLHGTLQLDIPQESIRIGLPGYNDERQVTFGKMLALPFRKNAPIPYLGTQPLFSFISLPAHSSSPLLAP